MKPCSVMLFAILTVACAALAQQAPTLNEEQTKALLFDAIAACEGRGGMEAKQELDCEKKYIDDAIAIGTVPGGAEAVTKALLWDAHGVCLRFARDTPPWNACVAQYIRIATASQQEAPPVQQMPPLPPRNIRTCTTMGDGTTICDPN